MNSLLVQTKCRELIFRLVGFQHGCVWTRSNLLVWICHNMFVLSLSHGWTKLLCWKWWQQVWLLWFKKRQNYTPWPNSFSTLWPGSEHWVILFLTSVLYCHKRNTFICTAVLIWHQQKTADVIHTLNKYQPFQRADKVYAAVHRTTEVWRLRDETLTQNTTHMQ